MGAKRARVFNISQYEYHPFEGYESAESDVPKRDAEPLLTQKAIDDALAHRSIKQWAYIWHDKDVHTEESAAKARERGYDVHAGDRIHKHAHIVLNIPSNMDVSQVANWFGIEPQYIDLPKGRGAFMDCVEYLTHESEKEQAKGKYLYPDDAIHANFDFRAELTVRAARRERYGSAADRMTPAKELQMHVLEDGWSVKRCSEEDPLTYVDVRDKLFKLRLDYLRNQPPCPARINLYVDGNGGLGKGVLSDYIAHKMFPNVEDPVFIAGNDPRVAFDGYDGEPVIIWDDWRSYQFFQAFGRGGTFNIFDTHPRAGQSQQAKHTRVVLTNAVNIVNSVQPYREFLDGLAGGYKDRAGIQHEVEDANQAYRRFPLIIHVHEDDLEILLNQGFMDKDSYAYQQYYMSERIRGSLKNIASQLAGDLKDKMLDTVTTPVMNAYDKLLKSHDDKITDPSQLPEEFKYYGEVLTPEQAAEEDMSKAAFERERNEVRRIDNLFRYIDAYLRFYHPMANESVLEHCRGAWFNAEAHMMSDDMKSFIGEDVERVCADVKTFTIEEVTAMTFRDATEAYRDWFVAGDKV